MTSKQENIHEETFEFNFENSYFSTRASKDFGYASITLDVTSKSSRTYLSSFFPGESSNKCSHRTILTIKATATKEKSDLKLDLEKVLFSEELSDFTFIVNNERIPVNKFILSARSPVFNKQFNSEFKEKDQNEQILELTFSLEAFKELIRFIYTDKVCDLNKHALELLQASDYYQIDSLKSICENILPKILDENNANDIFQSAHLYRCSETLKKPAFDLIKKQFCDKNFKLSDSLIDNPKKISNLVKHMDSLKNELNNLSIAEE